MSIALYIPHTPWVPERVGSMNRLRDQLAVSGEADFYLEYVERATNKEWPRRCMAWALETGADHVLTLNDDVLVAPCFWPALRAMIGGAPARIVGLAAVHPLGPEMARQGHRWYRTKSWGVGWANLVPRADLVEYVKWFDAHPERVATTNEDSLLNEWITETDRDTWHPVPTLADHDVSLESQYQNDADTHRRATVTWRSFAEADLCSVDWWRQGSCPLLPLAWQRNCWACTERPIAVGTRGTGLGLCKLCVLQFAGNLMGLAVSFTGNTGVQ